MHLFRRTPSYNELSVRFMRENDQKQVDELIEQTTWAFSSVAVNEFSLLLNDQMALVAEKQDKLWAMIAASWSLQPAVWIRMLAIHHSLRPKEIIPRLLADLKRYCVQQHAQTMYLMLDERDEQWLQPSLSDAGFVHTINVIGYEKRRLDIPAWGNGQVFVRPAGLADLPVIAMIDAQAFPTEWVKSAVILGESFAYAPLYLIVEFDGQFVGYAFATSHYNGRMIHLVRIAVLPQYRQRGIGIRLLAEVVAWCQDHQVQVLSLNTQDDNLHAQQLYQWFGFVRNNERQKVLKLQLS